MPRINPISPSPISDDLGKDTAASIEQIRTQNNAGAQLLKVGNGNKLPRSGKKGDLTNAFHPRGILFTAYGDRGTKITTVVPRNAVDNIPTFEGTGVPTLAEFPNSGEYGWKIDPGVAGYWTINIDGTIYWATAISGGITFASISGTISNDQHGQLGRQTSGGNPHHTNATTAQPGFLSTTFFDLLNGATTAATANTIALRGAAGSLIINALTATTIGCTTITSTAITCTSINASSNIATSGNFLGPSADMTTDYLVAGTKVIGARDTGWTAPTATQSKAGFGNGASGTQIEQNLSAVINALMTHGILGA